MAAKQPWYVTRRADALAIVYLTGREDLEINGPQPDRFPDFEVRRGKGNGQRIFGVEVKAEAGPLSEKQWQQMVRSARRQASSQEVGYPVCLFLVDTVSSEARYTWLVAPVVEPDGHARLEWVTGSETKPMSYMTVDEIVEAVDRFYDALVVRIPA